MDEAAIKAARERRERLRERMRSFYNCGDPQGSGLRRPSMAPSDVPSGLLGIDSVDFDSRSYAADVLQHTSLQGLYQKDTTLRGEIRSLDGSLQELVYNNYNKFINATDTIREMKDNVVDIDEKLRELSSSVAHIGDVSAAVSAKLHSQRKGIEELLLRNRIMQKIKFLVELPASLQRDLENDQLGSAVRHWVTGNSILSRHQNIAAFQRTHSDCRLIARQLWTKLQNRIKLFDLTAVSSGSLDESLLIDVNDFRRLAATHIDNDHTEEMAEAWLRGTLVDKALKPFVKTIDDSIATLSSIDAVVPSELGRAQVVVSEAKMACELFKEWMYVVASTLNAAEECVTITQNTLMDQFSRIVLSVGAVMQQGCSRIVQQTWLAPPEDTRGGWIVHAVDAVCAHISSLGGSFRTIVTSVLNTHSAAANERIDEFTRDAFTMVLTACDGLLYGPLIARGEPRDVTHRREAVHRVIIAAAVAQTFCMGSRLEKDPILRGAFEDVSKKLVARFINVFTTHCAELLEPYFNKKAGDPAEPDVLVTALAAEWQAAGAVAAAVAPATAAQPLKNAATASKGSGSRASNPATLQVVASYTRAAATGIASALDDSKALFSKGSAAIIAMPRVFDAPHVLELLVVLSLVSLLEGIRGTVLSRNGFQQLQVDLSFLLQFLQPRATDWHLHDGRVGSLIDECAASGFDQCVERVPLASATVAKLAKLS